MASSLSDVGAPYAHVAIVCDVGQVAGGGHASRCMAVAENLRARGARVTWFADLKSLPWLVDEVQQAGDQVREGSADLEAAVIGSQADVVLVDSYLLPDGFGARLLSEGRAVAALQDPATPRRPASSQWSPGFAPGQPGGPDRVLIRTSLTRLRTEAPPVPPAGPWQVGVLMGGTSSRQLTAAVSQALGRVEHSLAVHVNVPLGGDAGRQVVHEHPLSASYWQTLAACHLIVTAAGVSAWESLYVGVPCALIQTADNQAPNYWGMTGRGWALGLGTGIGLTGEPGHLAQGVTDALTNYPRTRTSALSAQSAIDGLGAQRLADHLLDLVGRSGPRSAG